MSAEFKREERYVVFKLSDLGNSLKGDEIRRLAKEYAEQRGLKGKAPLECVVVESDWPEYEPTWKAIEARVTGAQPVPSFPEGVKKVTRGFHWNGAAQHHTPTIEVEFEPAPAGSPNNAKGWQDRDRLAAMLAAPPEAAEKVVLEAYQRGYLTGQEEIEKERDALRTELADLRSSMTFRTSLIGRIEAERDALRAKIAEMEKQEPVARFNWSKGELEWLRPWNYRTMDMKPLYLAPGAQGEKK